MGTELRLNNSAAAAEGDTTHVSALPVTPPPGDAPLATEASPTVTAATVTEASPPTVCENTESKQGGFNRLESGWSVWEIRKAGQKYRQQETAEYATCLTLVNSFHSVEGFFSCCQKEHNVEKYLNGEKSLAVFRSRRKPMWEYFPRGGRVVLRLRSEGLPALRSVWEEMLLLLVGENFGTPCVVGAMLNVKSSREASLSYWLSEDSLHGQVKGALRTLLSGNDVIQCLPFKSLKRKPRRVIGKPVGPETAPAADGEVVNG